MLQQYVPSFKGRVRSLKHVPASYIFLCVQCTCDFVPLTCLFVCQDLMGKEGRTEGGN